MVKTRNFAVPITIYLGSGTEALELLERIQKHCEKEEISVSQFVVELIEREIGKGK